MQHCVVAGRPIPAIGFGVGTAWFAATPGLQQTELARSVHAALDAGATQSAGLSICHIDEAEMYQNEGTTGAAMSAWLTANPATPRGSLFVTSKVMSVDDGIESVCKRTLAALQLSYLDLYLIHAPFQRSGAPFATPLLEAWRQMEALVDAGLVRAIGVSNWRVADLRQIVDSARIAPSCNQVEAHPYLQQPALMRFCKEHSILVTAYSPLAPLTKPALHGGPVDAAVAAAAAVHGRTMAQVLLRWSLQTGRLPVTTTSKPKRIGEYLGIFDFQLSAQQVHAISAAGALKQQRFFWTKCGGQFKDDPLEEEDSAP